MSDPITIPQLRSLSVLTLAIRTTDVYHRPSYSYP